MNGLPSTNSGSDQSLVETVTVEQLRALFRSTSKDSKVIFGAFRGVFDLSRNDIENFFHLINQRVGEQNLCDGSLCEIAVYYSDGTSRKFPSVKEFNSYSETRDRTPTVITMHIVHLIVFPDSDNSPDSDNFEKQQIDIEIRTSQRTSETLDMVNADNRLRMAGDKVQIGVNDNSSELGLISYTINHSKISWGLDLEGHIASQIQKLLEPITKWDRFLNRIAGPLNVLTTVFIGLFLCNIVIDVFFSFLYQTDANSTSTPVLEIAANYLINGQIAKYIVASLVVSIVIFIVFSAFVSSVIRSMKRPKPSFITLDDGDERKKAARLKNYDRRWVKMAGILIANLAVAVFISLVETRLSGIIGPM